MTYTTNQVAQMLKTTVGTVSYLVRKGKLKSKERNPGKRSHLHFDRKTVMEFKKTYVNRLNKKTRKRAKTVGVKSNLPMVFKNLVTKKDIIQLENRMNLVESKLDTLIKMWS